MVEEEFRYKVEFKDGGMYKRVTRVEYGVQMVIYKYLYKSPHFLTLRNVGFFLCVTKN